MVYFLPLRISVTGSVGMITFPIFSCRPNACTRDSSDSRTLRSKPEYVWMMYHFMFGFDRVVSLATGVSPSTGASPFAFPFLISSVIDWYLFYPDACRRRNSLNCLG